MKAEFEILHPTIKQEFLASSSESEKALELYWPYLFLNGIPAVGIDIASGGHPCVPWAINFDLPEIAYQHYTNGGKPAVPLHMRGFAEQALPFESDSFVWAYSSHVLEDFTYDQWPALFREWSRIVRPGGHLIVLTPDRERWNYAIRELGQPCNCSHKFEGSAGDMSRVAESIGLVTVMDRLTDLYEHDYGLIGVFRKP